MSKQSGSLHRYILTRFALAVPMVLILLVLVFAMTRMIPGDPIAVVHGGKLSAAELATRRRAAGLDRPLMDQFWRYLRSVATLSFGRTFSDHLRVRDVIIQRGGATLSLSMAALIVATAIGVPLGLLAGRFRDRGIDVGARLFAISTYAAPVFVLGLLARLAFGDHGLGWLPASGQASSLVSQQVPTVTQVALLDALIAGNGKAAGDILRHLVLPSIALGLLIVGVVIRMIRGNLIRTLQSDYVEAARARGVKEASVLTRHAFRNALVPVVAVFGPQIAVLLGGSVLIEQTFNWPGIGQALISYLNARDYAAVQGIIAFFALVAVVIWMLTDFVAALIDPRVRY